MNKFKIFIDGREGTTGLQIDERLSSIENIEILQINPEKRKDINERKTLLNSADYVFLCLPDEAAKESVSLTENKNTVIIDASTAHRTNPGWAYGFPELSVAHKENILSSKRIAVPGCHATGFISLIYPLIKEDILSADEETCCQTITGYSGGGKSLIAKYEAKDRNKNLKSPAPYALGLTHKHLPEMKYVCGLASNPLFMPILGDIYKGMNVLVPFFTKKLKGANPAALSEFYTEYYKNLTHIKIIESKDSLYDGLLFATPCNGTNNIEISVFGNNEQVILSARLDNLGKGSSGAAVQLFNMHKQNRN